MPPIDSFAVEYRDGLVGKLRGVNLDQAVMLALAGAWIDDPEQLAAADPVAQEVQWDASGSQLHRGEGPQVTLCKVLRNTPYEERRGALFRFHDRFLLILKGQIP